MVTPKLIQHDRDQDQLIGDINTSVDEISEQNIALEKRIDDILKLLEDATSSAALQQTITLKQSEWHENIQTVSVPGVGKNSVVIIGVPPESYSEYTESFINCNGKDVDTLIFGCENHPSIDIKVSVIIIEGSEGGMVLNVIPTSLDSVNSGPYIIIESCNFTTTLAGVYTIQAVSGGGGGGGSTYNFGGNSCYQGGGGGISSATGLAFLPRGFNVAVSVGEGGAGGAAGAAGSPGGASGFGAYVVTGSGAAGAAGTSSTSRTATTFTAEDSVYKVTSGTGAPASSGSTASAGTAGSSGVVYVKLISNKLYYLFKRDNLRGSFYLGNEGNYRVVAVSGGGSGATGITPSAGSTIGGRGGVNMVEFSPVYIVPGVYTITVGAGGSGVSGNSQKGTDGGTTSFGSIVSASGSGTGGSPGTAAANGSSSIFPQSVTVDNFTVSGGDGSAFTSSDTTSPGTNGCLILEYLGGGNSLILYSLTYTFPMSGKYKITCVSGGGGGSSSSTSGDTVYGGNGGVNIATYEGTFTKGDTVPVTIGAGGAGSTDYGHSARSAAKVGGDTVFGNYVTASGENTNGFWSEGSTSDPDGKMEGGQQKSITLGGYTATGGDAAVYSESGTAGTHGCVYVEYLGE